MKRKAQYVYAGHGGKPVYVDGYLTDESWATPGSGLRFEVTGSGPEPGPPPREYGPQDLPGGWMKLMPDQEREWSKAEDQAVKHTAVEAGFPLIE